MMEDLSLHILDIVENAVAAGATRIAVSVTEDERRDLLLIRVADNGPGMSKRALRRALDPFFSTKGKRTGLGLPFLAQAAEQCGGRMTLRAAPGRGTAVTSRFRYGHIDRPPLTNMKGTLLTIILGHPEIVLVYTHRRGERTFRFRSRTPPGPSGPAVGLGASSIAAVSDALEGGLRRLGRT
ncbi:MAG: ATP-binding protein [Candidatus Aminicenantes bacterium]|nr:ATP-binding protein [Candidatus Aminicenantes bacterium]